MSNKWEPRAPLDVSPWNLLPSVQLSRRAVVLAHVGWLAFGFLLCFAQDANWLKYAIVSMVSLLPVQYLLDRIRRRPARLGPQAVTDDDTPMPLRVALDVCAIVMIVTVSAALVRDMVNRIS
jgi:hypothetical protein